MYGLYPVVSGILNNHFVTPNILILDQQNGHNNEGTSKLNDTYTENNPFIVIDVQIHILGNPVSVKLLEVFKVNMQ